MLWENLHEKIEGKSMKRMAEAIKAQIEFSHIYLAWQWGLKFRDGPNWVW